MNKYLELKKKHQEEVDNFPMFFAFNNEQLNDGMKEFGVTDTKEICSIYGGGYIKKTDFGKLKEMFSRQSKERKEAIENDKNGDGYILDMFEYELNNHEYSYTMDISDTLDCLGLTVQEINDSPKLLKGLKSAMVLCQSECGC